MLSVTYAECRKQTHYAKCRYAEWLYAECRFDECRGAVILFNHIFNENISLNCKPNCSHSNLALLV